MWWPAGHWSPAWKWNGHLLTAPGTTHGSKRDEGTGDTGDKHGEICLLNECQVCTYACVCMDGRCRVCLTFALSLWRPVESTGMSTPHESHWWSRVSRGCCVEQASQRRSRLVCQCWPAKGNSDWQAYQSRTESDRQDETCCWRYVHQYTSHLSRATSCYCSMTLCYHDICCRHVSVHPSVRPSQAGTVPKRLNVGSSKQCHTIVQGF